MRIVWVKKALDNLEDALDYVAQDNIEAAIKMGEYIRSQIDILRDKPYIGREGRVYGTRELVIDKYPYIIPYRVKDGELQILEVFHTSRKPPK